LPPSKLPREGCNGGAPQPVTAPPSASTDAGPQTTNLTTNLGRLPKRSDRRIYSFIHELSSNIMTPSGLLTNRRLMTAICTRRALGAGTEYRAPVTRGAAQPRALA
jgi:hypothetical protein